MTWSKKVHGNTEKNFLVVTEGDKKVETVLEELS